MKRSTKKSLYKIFVSLFVVFYTFFPQSIVIGQVIDEMSSQENAAPIETQESIPQENAAPTEVVPEEKPLWVVDGNTAVTSNPVELDKEYTAPQNNKVKIKFTKLPDNPSSVKIEEITLTEEEIKVSGAVSNEAYDITADMIDGTFEYDLVLPSVEEGTKVVYAENRDSILSDLKEVDNTIVNNGDTVKIEDLEHFTIFILSNPIEVKSSEVKDGGSSASEVKLQNFALKSSLTDPIALTSVTGVWTAVNGGLYVTGLNTNEVRWGSPASAGGQKSGLRFDGSAAQSFDFGDSFLLGALTHFNYPIYDAASGATLKITLHFERPVVSPDPSFTYVFNIEETSNNWWNCPSWQQSYTPCDDRITFPNSYGETSFEIDDIRYTLKINGFVNSYPGGTPVSQFITEEGKSSTAYLIGSLSSVLIERPDISIKKETNGIDVSAAPGPNLYIGDTVNWKYVVQNTGNVTLTNISVTDNPSVTITCPGTSLSAGATMECSASGTVSAGQFTNTATVTGKTPSDTTVTATDSSWYMGIPKKGHLIVQKTTIPAGDSTSFAIDATGSGTITGGGAGTITDSTDKNYEVTPGTYSVTETVPAGWSLTSNGCTNIDVAAGETTYCTITNTKNGSITIIKDSQPNSTQSFGFSTTGEGLTDFALSDDGLVYHNERKTFNNLLPGSYTVTETLGDPGHWTLTNLVCEDPTNNSSADTTNPYKANINLAAGENITCTFTNTMYGSITVQKNVDLNGDGDFSDTGETNATDWTWKLNNDSGHPTGTTAGNLLPATYTVSEIQKDGYHVNKMSCRVTSGGATTTDYGAVTSGDIILSAGQTFVCTFTNIRDTGTIELKKVWSGTPGQTTLNIGSAVGEGDIKTVQTGANGGIPLTTGQQVVPTGTYYLSESGGLDGYTKSPLSCFNDANNNGSQDTGELPITVGTNDSVSVETGNHIVCSYTNTRQQGTIIVKKVMVGGTDTFTFTGTPSGPINTNEGTLSATVDTGQYTTTEDVLTGWKLTGIYCSDTNSTGDINTKTATFNVESGETVTCTFTNTKYGSVSGYKYEDSDGKDDTTSDRTLLSGWVINLWQWVTDKFVDTGKTATTDSNGYYIFDNLLSGLYQVHEVLQDGWANLLSPGDITLDAGENDQNNNFVNYRVGSITIVKDRAPNYPEQFSYSGDLGSFDLTDDGGASNQKTFSNLIPGSYKVVETPTSETYLDSIVCSGDSDGGTVTTLANNYVTIDLDQGENITCTFTNRLKGKIIVEKQTLPNGSTQSFNFTASYDSDGFSLTDGESNDSGYIRAGNYSVSEASTTGWSLTNTSCVSSIEDTETVSSLELDAGEIITCTFTNTRDTGSVAFVKTVDLGPGQPSEWKFAVYDSNGTLIGDTFASGSTYNLNTGTYTVTEIPSGNAVEGYSFDTASGICSFDSTNNKIVMNVTVNGGTCTIANKRDRGSVKVNKKTDTNGDDSFETDNSESNALGFRWILDWVNWEFGTQVNNLATTTTSPYYYHTFGENIPTGYHFVSWYNTSESDRSCTNPNGTTLPNKIQVNKNQVTEITLCNARDTGTITIVKDAIGGNDTFGFTITGETGSTQTINTNEVKTTGPIVVTTGSYSVSETSIPTGWKNTSVSCKDETGTEVTSNFSVQTGKNITCTFTNQKNGHLIVQKTTLPSGDPTSFSINLLNAGGTVIKGGTISDSTDQDFEVDPGSYSVNEYVPGGWSLTSNGCTNVSIAAGETKYCTITNTKNGSITIVKDAQPDSYAVFTFYVHFNDIYQTYFNLQDTGSVIFNHTTMTNLLPGKYSVAETAADPSWYLDSVTCNDGSSYTYGGVDLNINLSAGENVTCTFTNKQKGAIIIEKQTLPDGSTETFEFNPSWSDSNFSLKDGRAYDSGYLVEGTYSVAEIDKLGWTLSNVTCDDGSNPSNISLQPGETVRCVFTNTLNTIQGYKWNDIDIDGIKDSDEPLLPGWTINLYESNELGFDETPIYTTQTGSTGDSLGMYSFDHLLPATYKVCEEQKDGWNQSYPIINESNNCYIVTLPGRDGYNFGNYAIPSQLSITKDNNSPIEGLLSGSTVIYTIIVTAPTDEKEGTYLINNVKVTDILPKGFEYISGTWTANSSVRGNIKGSITTEPVYNEGLATWNLGDMKEGEVVTLTYTAKINLLNEPGLYKDIAFVQGDSLLATKDSGDVLGISYDPEGYLHTDKLGENFVGTEVKVIEPIEEGGEVLGASTTLTLPRTGAETYITLGAIISMILGLLLLVFNNKKKSKVLVLTLTLLLGMFVTVMPKNVYAQVSPKIEVRIEEPKTPITKRNFTISYVALSIPYVQLQIQCEKSLDGITYTDFDTPKTTNSGVCNVDDTIITDVGTYYFRVKATDSTNESNYKYSDPVSVTIVNNPLPVSEYSKTKTACIYTLKFKSLTSKVQIFRSDNQKSFYADDTTLITKPHLTVTPNILSTYTDTPADCSKEYYYAVRAVDEYSNVSSIVTDNIVTVIETTAPAQTTQEESEVAGEKTTTQEEGETPSTGEVAGEETTSQPEEETKTDTKDETKTEEETKESIWNKYKYLIISVIVVALGSGIYNYIRRKK